MGIKVLHLVQKELVILPKIFCSEKMTETEKEQAFAHEFIRLANEITLFRGYKIDKHDANKVLYPVLFHVDRTNIHCIKHKPIRNDRIVIAICDVVDVEFDKTFHRQWTLSY